MLMQNCEAFDQVHKQERFILHESHKLKKKNSRISFFEMEVELYKMMKNGNWKNNSRAKFTIAVDEH